MPIPGVGAGVELTGGVARATLGALRESVVLRAGRLITGAAVITAGAMATERATGRDTEAPRSTQRSGSSVQREPAWATDTDAAIAATTTKR